MQKVGKVGGYQWGAPRKQAMLAWEAAQKEEGAEDGG
jgi:O6-methylguanine-DNA--protein-cysteine methyltransferase